MYFSLITVWFLYSRKAYSCYWQWKLQIIPYLQQFLYNLLNIKKKGKKGTQILQLLLGRWPPNYLLTCFCEPYTKTNIAKKQPMTFVNSQFSYDDFSYFWSQVFWCHTIPCKLILWSLTGAKVCQLQNQCTVLVGVYTHVLSWK